LSIATLKLISFHKYSACGNDFILIDNRSEQFPLEKRELIARLCHRQQGIGADGLILLENPSIENSVDHYRMRIFNSDGGEAEMCGNGIRCLYKFIRSLGEEREALKIETMHRSLLLQEKGDQVSVQMGDPQGIRWDLSLPVPHYSGPIHFLDTGVPHAVLFVDDLERVEMRSLGKALRHHQAFGSGGANVNAAQLVGGKELQVRTYERGVEDETLACGTGVTAAALAAARVYRLQSPIAVRTRSKESMEVDFQQVDGLFTQVALTGPATFIFQGIIL
jgi:diaminopimelate epimerase